MADGGASTYIFLATALLISGAVSAVLIGQYGNMTSAMEVERRAAEADSKTSFDYAGDLSNLAYDTTDPAAETITIYLQNTGEYTVDATSLFIQLDGVIVPDVDVSTTILPAGGVWGTTELLEVEMTGTWALADNSDIKLTILVFSVTVAGYEGQDSQSTEARLNEL